MKKKLIITAVVLIPVVLAGFFILRKDKTFDIEWETKEVEKGDINIEVTATGTLEAVTEVEVGTQVSGIINELYVDYNSKVKKGQVIARLDTTTLAAQVFDSRANLERVMIRLNQAERDWKRTQQLFEEKVVAQVEYDQVLDDYETAKSNVLSAEAQLNRNIINLNYATITAPIDGIVISKSVEMGQTVAASFNSPTLFNIVNDLTKMQVEASVDEADIGQITEGQSVTFTVDAYPDDQFEGVVRQVRYQPVIVSNVVNYTVIVDVANPDIKLLPGMTANITVNIDKREDVLKVPSRALSFTPPTVYLALLYAELPDSIKQQQEERIAEMTERMKSMGMSQQQIDQMVERVRLMGIFGGGQQQRPEGMARGFGGGISGGQRPAGQRPQMGNRSQRFGNFGQVWIKDGEIVRPVRVRTGITDGSNVEIISEELEEGTLVVISALYDEEQEEQVTQTNNPFAPTPPGRGRGMR
jgi:HlyD family secretion protein